MHLVVGDLNISAIVCFKPFWIKLSLLVNSNWAAAGGPLVGVDCIVPAKEFAVSLLRGHQLFEEAEFFKKCAGSVLL